MNRTPDGRSSRREFLRTSAGAAVGGALAAPLVARAAAPAPGKADTLRVGLIGCGGRGTGAALNALQIAERL